MSNDLQQPPHNLHHGKYTNTPKQVKFKPVHQRLSFWIGVILVFVAIGIYIMSVDFTVQPDIIEPLQK